jgi:flagellar basal-body rod protein FlgC
MSFLGSLDIGASALSAQRLRMDIIAQNIANVNTTRTDNGTPYRRRTVLFEEKKSINPFPSYLSDGISQKHVGRGVRVTRIIEDNAPFKKIHEPGHPDSDAEGYVQMPNVDVITEMVNMISATRAYEANVTSINTTKSMAVKALEIGR